MVWVTPETEGDDDLAWQVEVGRKPTHGQARTSGLRERGMGLDLRAPLHVRVLRPRMLFSPDGCSMCTLYGLQKHQALKASRKRKTTKR